MLIKKVDGSQDWASSILAALLFAEEGSLAWWRGGRWWLLPALY